ncbi:leucine-rich repeat-containing protein 18 [Antennarius striatus]|uniref:leucine-rich repeat-containing protein 18 n=1 Tax=Antennarius striatus TaxID=241820 RepID=UPI0035AEC354
MAKGKEAKGTKVTLKIARKAIRMMPNGQHRLTLSNMGITVFPKCLLKLTNVDELDLSRNLIEKLPESIGNFSSLQWVDLHSNRLESVPESIGKLVGLTHLNLSNNRLTSAGLPSTLGSLTRLKSFNLGLNQLDTLPLTLNGLESLQELGLFDNCFTKVPEFVTSLRNLTKVNMKRNWLSYSQDDGNGMMKKKSESKEEVYLVHESNLCGTCLKRCKEQGERFTKGGGSVMIEDKRMKTYSGLMVPNSVARVHQDVWRIRPY